jgi:pyridoxal phosphate enzyme (YggS family)
VISAQVAAVRERIARAAARASRSPNEITLVAVTKTHPPDVVAAAFAAGLRDFGENKVQEAQAKIEATAALKAQGARWHLIGHLQSNKVGKAATLFDCIHSIHSREVGARLDRHAAASDRALSVLVQVDLAREPTKSGVEESQLVPLLESLRNLSHLRVDGLMCIPPASDDPEKSRPFFRRLREWRDQAAAHGLLHGRELSMGMSADYEVAIEEGATIVRVGSALFGERVYG